MAYVKESLTLSDTNTSHNKDEHFVLKILLSTTGKFFWSLQNVNFYEKNISVATLVTQESCFICILTKIVQIN
jgi:hypothetical protein